MTERYRFEEALRKSEAEYKNLVNNALVGIYKTNVSGDIIFVNDILVRIFEFDSREEMMAQAFYNLYKRPEDRKKLLKLLMQTGKVDAFESEVLTKRGNTKTILLSAYLEGDILNGMIMDITRRKQAEQEREKKRLQDHHAQKMEAIGTLAGEVAHDFNNLLTGIQGHVELAMNNLDEDHLVYSYLKAVQRASSRATSLTRQLLLFSRRQLREPVILNINNVAENMIRMIKRIIGENIEVRDELGCDLWNVQGDEGEIELMIMNLAVNARDAMPRGGKLTIRIENVTLDETSCKGMTESRPGRFVCLSIIDEGLGIDKKILPHVFDPFFTTKETGNGTGLGLAVVYGIVKQHDGWVSICSTKGRGSTFKIYLPAVFKEVDKEAKRVPSLKNLQGSGERVLVVEDEKEVREFASRALRVNGYLVLEAKNAKQALEVFDRENGGFALVFCDVVLPDESGLWLAERINSRKSGMEIILTSGYADNKAQWSTIREKGYRFLHKPYSLSDLLKVVKEAVG